MSNLSNSTLYLFMSNKFPRHILYYVNHIKCYVISNSKILGQTMNFWVLSSNLLKTTPYPFLSMCQTVLLILSWVCQTVLLILSRVTCQCQHFLLSLWGLIVCQTPLSFILSWALVNNKQSKPRSLFKEKEEILGQFLCWSNIVEPT